MAYSVFLSRLAQTVLMPKAIVNVTNVITPKERVSESLNIILVQRMMVFSDYKLPTRINWIVSVCTEFSFKKFEQNFCRFNV
jgi:hypothetical protein